MNIRNHWLCQYVRVEIEGLDAVLTTLDNCKIMTRPYTSLKGAKKSGPIMNEIKKIEKTSFDTNDEWMLRSWSICASEGAIMDEAIGVMSAIRDTSSVESHFRFRAHLFGFSGSSGPSQVICLGASAGRLDDR